MEYRAKVQLLSRGSQPQAHHQHEHHGAARDQTSEKNLLTSFNLQALLPH